MLVYLIKLALALTTPHSADWIDEQAHVRCFAALDQVSTALADRVCADDES